MVHRYYRWGEQYHPWLARVSNNTDRQGYVQVYSLDNNDDAGDDTWNQIGQDVIGEADSNCFGYSVSISEDGKIIAVIVINSAKYNLGYVRIYCLDDDGTSWEQIGKDIDGEAAVDNFGLSVSLSANRSTIAIGAPYNNDNIDASFQFQVVVYKIDTVKGQAGNCWSRHPRRQCRRWYYVQEVCKSLFWRQYSRNWF